MGFHSFIIVWKPIVFVELFSALGKASTNLCVAQKALTHVTSIALSVFILIDQKLRMLGTVSFDHGTSPCHRRGVEPTVMGTWMLPGSNESVVSGGAEIASIILQHARCCRASLNQYEAHAARGGGTQHTPTCQ